jgi:7-keto-8-aminopelargonate synthetase-like enzyme
MQPEIHRFRNNQKAIPLGNRSFEAALEHGALDLRVKYVGNDRFENHDGHQFVNFCSCSYLGLHFHPSILGGAHKALDEQATFSLPLSRIRLRFQILEQLEEGLSELYRADSLVTISCGSATAGVLPLVASGHLMDDGDPRVMIFDKYCHFSMNLIKPICADETLVLTSPHNDLDFIEDACKKHEKVCYVADGAYSMGGATMIDGLLELQNRYGLFLYFDDSHSLSAYGERGEGFVRSQLSDQLDPLTIIVGSLGKGFGASGGVVMMGNPKHREILVRFGGPIAWSQAQNAPTVGACLGALEVHKTAELGQLQQKLRDNTELFDRLIPTSEAGNGLPIRLIPCGREETAATFSGEMFERGYYTSAVFFPIVERGKAGLRVMLRADNRPEDIQGFCDAAREVVGLD